MKTIGIDLGTTFSALAVLNEGGVPEIIPNREGERITPSVVFFDGDSPIVGTIAKTMAASAPLNVVQFVKRHMGNPTWKFQTSNGRTYTAEEISALILRRLKEDAEVALGGPIRDAVVTVPAYFNDAQRQATRDAGRIAGLNVVRMVNEPTAAALAYGLKEDGSPQTVLVFDLGGGTFDVTILRVGVGEIAVVATGGDKNLGGFDWDSQVGKLDDALGQYERAAKTAPNVPMFRAAVGNALLRQGKSVQAIPIFEECVKDEPDNESFQWGLAIAYVDSCQHSWTYVGEGETVPEGYYATSKEQVLEALEFIRKAEQLKYDDPVVKEHIVKVKEDVKWMLTRKYHGRTLAAIVGGIAYTPLLGLGLIFCPFYFYASRPPQYALNKDVIKGVTTVGDKALAAVGKIQDAIGKTEAGGWITLGLGLMTLAATAALLPVMAILNYRKNYTGENDLKNLQIP